MDEHLNRIPTLSSFSFTLRSYCQDVLFVDKLLFLCWHLMCLTIPSSVSFSKTLFHELSLCSCDYMNNFLSSRRKGSLFITSWDEKTRWGFSIPSLHGSSEISLWYRWFFGRFESRGPRPMNHRSWGTPQDVPKNAGKGGFWLRIFALNLWIFFDAFSTWEVEGSRLQMIFSSIPRTGAARIQLCCLQWWRFCRLLHTLLAAVKIQVDSQAGITNTNSVKR